jgi:hypothetical protein
MYRFDNTGLSGDKPVYVWVPHREPSKAALSEATMRVLALIGRREGGPPSEERLTNDYERRIQRRVDNRTALRGEYLALDRYRRIQASGQRPPVSSLIVACINGAIIRMGRRLARAMALPELPSSGTATKEE